jgi:DNA topoisomerase VI subunit A
MAKRSTSAKSSKSTSSSAGDSSAGSKKLPAAVAAREERTRKQIISLADEVTRSSLAFRDPFVDVPARTLSNTAYNAKKRTLEMGDAVQRRNLFNVGQAKKFMQTMLVAAGTKSLVDAGKTLSLRGMYYKCLHTIAGTKEKTLADQEESDAVLEDLEVALGSIREELHIFAENRGNLVGNITLTDSGDEIDCRRMGSGGYGIPSIVEPGIIDFKKVDAKFVLHVEKGTVWQRFNEDRFWEKHNCILMHGGGQPSRGVRRLLRRFNQELGLPVYCLLDCDPWGHYIYSVIKQGSINLAFESQRMAVPDAKFLGIRAIDYQRCDLTDDVQIALNERDTARAKQIAEYPWFREKKAWQLEIKQMLGNGFKMEVESLITKDISYVTEVYVPERLKAKDWLD